MRRKNQLFTCVAFIFLCFTLSAQLEGANWYFGNYAGVNFTTSPPNLLLNGNLSTSEGSSSISDKNGNLLFYTDGQTVYNSTHQIMANGSNLLGNPSSTMSSVVCPKPGTYNASLGKYSNYYIVTIGVNVGASGVCYSEVNLTANGGLGEVVLSNKNTHLFGTTTVESANFAKHANGCDFWLLGKDATTNQWFSYLITAAGVSTTPVISATGPNSSVGWGTIKVSADNSFVGFINNGNAKFQIYDFDNSTGLLTHRYGDNSITSGYSLEISNNNRYIYTSLLNNANIYQYDVTATTPAAFMSSKTLIGTTSNTAHAFKVGTLQKAPDGKIYLARTGSTFLGCINSPNSPGTLSNFVDLALDISGQNVNGAAIKSTLGLPSFPSFIFVQQDSIKIKPGCLNGSHTFSITGSSNINSYQWFVSPQNTPYSTSPNGTSATLTENYPSGNYKIKCVVDYGCYLDTLLSTFTSEIPPLLEFIDDSLCIENSAIYVEPTEDYDQYLWSNNATTKGISISTPGTYSCRVATIGENMIINGDFEQGDQYFTTEYNNGGSTLNQGQYTIDNNISTGWWSGCVDHTTGTGDMMIADAACGSFGVPAGADLWCQTVEVNPNTDYIFSAFVTNANNNPGIVKIGFYVDGVIIGDTIPSLPTPCSWNNYSQIWNSGSNTQIEICIKELTMICVGADFAIDDIYFSRICYQTKDIHVFPTPKATISVTDSVCQLGNVPVLTLAGTNGTSKYAITYSDDNGAASTVLSNINDSVMINISNSTPGIYTYFLNKVEDTLTSCNTIYNDSVKLVVSPLPSATIHGNDTLCLNSPDAPIIFKGFNNPVGTYEFTYSLDGGNDQTITTNGSDSVIIQQVTTTIGTYTYQLKKVRNLQTGCEKLLHDSIQVVILALPTASIIGNDTICLNELANVIFSGGNPTSASIFEYEINGTALQIASGPNNSVSIPVHTTSAGIQQIKLTKIVDINTSCSQLLSDSVQILVRPLPSSTLSLSRAVCLNDTSPVVTFSGNDGIAPYQFIYTINGVTQDTLVSTGNSATIAHPTDSAGIFNYVITTIVEGSPQQCPQNQSISTSITVFSLPIVEAGLDTVICENQVLTLTASGAQTYAWNHSVTNGSAFTPNQSGYYVVEGTDLNGCKNSDSLLLKIALYPQLNFGDSVVKGCSPLSVNLPYTSSEPTASCTWIVGSTTVQQTCAPFNQTFSQAGCYDITLTVISNLGCKTTLTKPSIACVYPNPIADFELDRYEVKTYSPEVITENHSTGATQYQWNFGDFTGSVNTENASHSFPTGTAGNYWVTLTAISDKGCIDSTSRIVRVLDEVTFYVPNAFTPDGNQFNQTFQPVIVAGIDPYNFNMKIFNRWGEIVFESNDQSIGWDGTYLGKLCQNGTYTWKIDFKERANEQRHSEVGHFSLIR